MIEFAPDEIVQVKEDSPSLFSGEYGIVGKTQWGWAIEVTFPLMKEPGPYMVGTRWLSKAIAEK